ncbi:hypothetical protein AB0K51_31475 [Kitasatospora sp. NPDC049285]|uniref:hypothetical protein n=1 Tax=Kitasatospora sp. NPDC049285 TaxID=3157096 RepID=UPI00342E5EFF
MHRIAARFLEQIDATAAGTSDDERGNTALRRLEDSLAAVTGRMVRTGHVVRWEMVYERRDRTPAAQVPGREQAPATPAAPALAPPRGGNGDGGTDAADGRIAPRGGDGPAVPRSPAERPHRPAEPVGGLPAGAGLTPPRGGNQAGGSATPIPPRGETRPAAAVSPTARQPISTLVPPARRGLGPHTYATEPTELGDGWEMRGRDDQEHLAIVVRDGWTVGWTEYGIPGTEGWLAVVGATRHVVDDQGQPLPHPTARHAAATRLLLPVVPDVLDALYRLEEPLLLTLRPNPFVSGDEGVPIPGAPIEDVAAAYYRVLDALPEGTPELVDEREDYLPGVPVLAGADGRELVHLVEVEVATADLALLGAFADALQRAGGPRPGREFEALESVLADLADDRDGQWWIPGADETAVAAWARQALSPVLQQPLNDPSGSRP